MGFVKAISEEKYYKELENYCRRIMDKRKYSLNLSEKEDILSGVFEKLIVLNPEVENVDSFKKGYFAKCVVFACLQHFEKRKKTATSNDLDLEIAYEEYDTSLELDTTVLKKLDNHPKLKAIFEDKFVNKLSFTEIRNKHNIERMDKCLNEAKKIITASEYSGIARIKDGKIEKVYHSLKSTAKDGFTSYRVSACCKGERKSYKGYEWKNLKNF